MLNLTAVHFVSCPTGLMETMRVCRCGCNLLKAGLYFCEMAERKLLSVVVRQLSFAYSMGVCYISRMLKASPVHHSTMTKNDVVSAVDAIAACETLTGFLRPMLRETRSMGERDGAAFLSGMIADIGALRGSLLEMLREDRQLQ
jgi:hypothetical protein